MVLILYGTGGWSNDLVPIRILPNQNLILDLSVRRVGACSLEGLSGGRFVFNDEFVSALDIRRDLCALLYLSPLLFYPNRLVKIDWSVLPVLPKLPIRTRLNGGRQCVWGRNNFISQSIYSSRRRVHIYRYRYWVTSSNIVTSSSSPSGWSHLPLYVGHYALVRSVKIFRIIQSH